MSRDRISACDFRIFHSLVLVDLKRRTSRQQHHCFWWELFYTMCPIGAVAERAGLRLTFLLLTQYTIFLEFAWAVGDQSQLRFTADGTLWRTCPGMTSLSYILVHILYSEFGKTHIYALCPDLWQIPQTIKRWW